MVDAQFLEEPDVLRVPDRADGVGDVETLLRELTDREVVLVVFGQRDEHVGAVDLGILQHIVPGGVAVVDRQAVAGGQLFTVAAVFVDDGELVTVLFQVLDEEVGLLIAAGDDDMHTQSSSPNIKS